MFCAKAGAKLVIAVDNSGIVEKARGNVIDNGLDGVVRVIRGKIEEVRLPVDRVDIIVSEWMGYCLLFEAMLDSVIWARDRYGGLMVPSHAAMYVAPLVDSDFVADNVHFWQDVYGFKMTTMLETVHEEVIIKPVNASAISGKPHAFSVLDLNRVKIEDLTFKNPFSVTVNGDHEVLDGWSIWFDIFFLPDREATLPENVRAEDLVGKGMVAFTTAPGSPQTHWQQGILLVKHGKGEPRALKDGQTISGNIAYRKPHSDSREVDIEMDWTIDSEGKGDQKCSQMWTLG